MTSCTALSYFLFSVVDIKVCRAQRLLLSKQQNADRVPLQGCADLSCYVCITSDFRAATFHQVSTSHSAGVARGKKSFTELALQCHIPSLFWITWVCLKYDSKILPPICRFAFAFALASSLLAFQQDFKILFPLCTCLFVSARCLRRRSNTGLQMWC